MKKSLLTMSTLAFAGLLGVSSLSLAAGETAAPAATPAAATTDTAAPAAAPMKIAHVSKKHHRHAHAKKAAAKPAATDAVTPAK